MKRLVHLYRSGESNRICDVLVEAIVEEYLKRDARSRLRISVSGGNQMVLVSGLAESTADFDIQQIIKQTYAELGFTDEIEIFITLEQRKRNDIAKSELSTPQDMTTVYGYATTETQELLPYPLLLALDMERKLQDATRLDQRFQWLGADGELLVVTDGRKLERVSLKVQHEKTIQLNDVKRSMAEYFHYNDSSADDWLLEVNGSGQFSEGGFQRTTGHSGWHAAQRYYGGLIPAPNLSGIGMDPYHPARSGMYFARFVAKKALKELGVKSAFVKLVYIAGHQEPIILEVQTEQGVPADLSFVSKADAQPEAIVERFQLQNAAYKQFAMNHPFLHSSAPFEDAA